MRLGIPVCPGYYVPPSRLWARTGHPSYQNCIVRRLTQWRLLSSFAAIVLGNAIYFLLLAPQLPEAARHQPFRLDLGLVLDFWLCVVCYGGIELLRHRRRHKRGPQ